MAKVLTLPRATCLAFHSAPIWRSTLQLTSDQKSGRKLTVNAERYANVKLSNEFHPQFVNQVRHTSFAKRFVTFLRSSWSRFRKPSGKRRVSGSAECPMHPHKQQLWHKPAELYPKLEYGNLWPLAARCDAISKGQPRIMPVLLHGRFQARFHRIQEHLRLLWRTRRGILSGAVQNGLHGNEKEVSSLFTPNYPYSLDAN